MNGKVLRDIRTEKGLSRQQLADLAGVTQVTIHKWETTQDANPQLKQFARVARVLGYSASELLCRLGQ